MTWLDNKEIKHSVADWPARAPHLNPIENFWSILQCVVSDEGATTYEQLNSAVNQTFAAPAHKEAVRNLMNSFKPRLERSVEVGGRWERVQS